MSSFMLSCGCVLIWKGMGTEGIRPIEFQKDNFSFERTFSLQSKLARKVTSCATKKLNSELEEAIAGRYPLLTRKWQTKGSDSPHLQKINAAKNAVFGNALGTNEIKNSNDCFVLARACTEANIIELTSRIDLKIKAVSGAPDKKEAINELSKSIHKLFVKGFNSIFKWQSASGTEFSPIADLDKFCKDLSELDVDAFDEKQVAAQVDSLMNSFQKFNERDARMRLNFDRLVDNFFSLPKETEVSFKTEINNEEPHNAGDVKIFYKIFESEFSSVFNLKNVKRGYVPSSIFQLEVFCTWLQETKNPERREVREKLEKLFKAFKENEKLLLLKVIPDVKTIVKQSLHQFMRSKEPTDYKGFVESLDRKLKSECLQGGSEIDEGLQGAVDVLKASIISELNAIFQDRTSKDFNEIRKVDPRFIKIQNLCEELGSKYVDSSLLSFKKMFLEELKYILDSSQDSSAALKFITVIMQRRYPFLVENEELSAVTARMYKKVQDAMLKLYSNENRDISEVKEAMAGFIDAVDKHEQNFPIVLKEKGSLGNISDALQRLEIKEGQWKKTMFGLISYSKKGRSWKGWLKAWVDFIKNSKKWTEIKDAPITISQVEQGKARAEYFFKQIETELEAAIKRYPDGDMKEELKKIQQRFLGPELSVGESGLFWKNRTLQTESEVLSDALLYLEDLVR